MTILLARSSPYEEDDLKEFLLSHECTVLVARELPTLYQLLSTEPVDAVLYNVVSMDDFIVIRYINDNFPLVKVVVSTDDGFSTAIENMRNGTFQTLKRPFRLNQLNDMFWNNMSPISEHPHKTAK